MAKKPGRKTRLQNAERFCFMMTPEDEQNMNTLIAIVPYIESWAAAIRYSLREIAKIEAQNIKKFVE